MTSPGAITVILLETWRAGGGGADFAGFYAEAEAFEVGLGERHEAGVEIAPHEEQQEGHGGVVFILQRVNYGCGEI